MEKYFINILVYFRYSMVRMMDIRHLECVPQNLCGGTNSVHILSILPINDTKVGTLKYFLWQHYAMRVLVAISRKKVI